MASDRDLAQRAVRAGAGAARRMASGELDVRRKTSPADLVSAADHASEEAIVALLRAERPGDAIVGEEGASVGAGSRRLVDGLDGTVNFLRAIPQWCVAVVLEEDGEPLATAVLDPARGELFSAARGEGAPATASPCASARGRRCARRCSRASCAPTNCAARRRLPASAAWPRRPPC